MMPIHKLIALYLFPALLGVSLCHAQEQGDNERNDESWNAKFQSTYVWQHKPGFNAPYSGPLSLSPQQENTYTWTATMALGKRLWDGGELYFDPEIAQGVPLSNLTGLGGFYNGEITRASGDAPILYMVRLFMRQTWGQGGGEVALPSAMNQMAGVVDKNRTVLTLGFLPPLDIFDNNLYAHDPRTQFMNWCNMTHCAFDYAADARGNSWGVALEYYRDDWVLRFGQFMQPILANQLPLDGAFFKHFGQNFEIEHAHQLGGQPGKLRLLAFRNTAVMGGYDDALNYAAANGGVPDTANTLQERQKYGVGLNLEQAITPTLGLFSRAMWQDGGSDTYAFTEVHRSLTAGLALNGALWGRERDTLGVSVIHNEISDAYKRYLKAGGAGFFIGDGALNYSPEQILETYYSLNMSHNIWLTADYQYMRNPAYNADRGPLSIVGVRLHWES